MIEAICGCMFSGKTEELIRRLRRAKIAKQNIVVFKPRIDNRYDGNHVVGHDGSSFSCMPIDIEDNERILGMIDDSRDAQVVGIDEGNFFPEGLIHVCETLANEGKRVIVSGLDMDFRAEPFEPMPSLMARAERVHKLTAICVRCLGVATRSQRIVDGRPTRYDDPLIVVGKDEMYEPRCRSCHVVLR